jgi:hypothetical protein
MKKTRPQSSNGLCELLYVYYSERLQGTLIIALQGLKHGCLSNYNSCTQCRIKTLRGP